MAIESEREVREDARGVGALFGGGEQSVAVGIDERKDGRKDGDTRGKAQLHLYVIGGDGDEGGLQILVKAMGRRGAGHPQDGKNESAEFHCAGRGRP